MSTTAEILKAGRGPVEIPQLDENHFSIIQEILTAIGDLPGVMDRIDAYLRGRGFEDPQAEICELRKMVF